MNKESRDCPKCGGSFEAPKYESSFGIERLRLKCMCCGYTTFELCNDAATSTDLHPVQTKGE